MITRTCVWLKFGMCRTFAHLESLPLTTRFIDDSLMCLTHCLPFVPHTTSNYTDFIAHDWNQEILLRHSARRITVWPSGRTHSSHRPKRGDILVTTGRMIFIGEEQGQKMKHPGTRSWKRIVWRQGKFKTLELTAMSLFVFLPTLMWFPVVLLLIPFS